MYKLSEKEGSRQKNQMYRAWKRLRPGVDLINEYNSEEDLGDKEKEEGSSKFLPSLTNKRPVT